MRSDRSRLAVRLLTAFVIGFVTLTLEIAYTRVVSFKLFYYYTYFVIGLALLGLGAASAVVSLSTRVRALDPIRLVQLVAPPAALLGLRRVRRRRPHADGHQPDLGRQQRPRRPARSPGCSCCRSH